MTMEKERDGKSPMSDERLEWLRRNNWPDGDTKRDAYWPELIAEIDRLRANFGGNTPRPEGWYWCELNTNSPLTGWTPWYWSGVDWHSHPAGLPLRQSGTTRVTRVGPAIEPEPPPRLRKTP